FFIRWPVPEHKIRHVIAAETGKFLDLGPAEFTVHVRFGQLPFHEIVKAARIPGGAAKQLIKRSNWIKDVSQRRRLAIEIDALFAVAAHSIAQLGFLTHTVYVYLFQEDACQPHIDEDIA